MLYQTTSKVAAAACFSDHHCVRVSVEEFWTPLLSVDEFWRPLLSVDEFWRPLMADGIKRVP